MGTMITGKENIHFAQGLMIASGLALEIRTGMKMSRLGSGIQAAQIQGFISEGRWTKKKALLAVVAKLKELDSSYKPSPSVQKVLDS